MSLRPPEAGEDPVGAVGAVAAHVVEHRREHDPLRDRGRGTAAGGAERRQPQPAVNQQPVAEHVGGETEDRDHHHRPRAAESVADVAQCLEAEQRRDAHGDRVHVADRPRKTQIHRA